MEATSVSARACLLEGHPGHAGEVDRLGRVERPRPRRRLGIRDGSSEERRED